MFKPKNFVLVKIANLGNGVKEFCFEKNPTLDVVLNKADVGRSNAKSISVNGNLVKGKENPQLKHNDIVVVVPAVRGG